MFLKEKLMVKVGPVVNNANVSLQDYSGIVLLNANKKPPHLGFFCSGKYFSLTANEVQLNQDLDSLFELINRKKIPSLFISLNQVLELSQIIKIFNDFSDLSSGITCIEPIKRIVGDLLKINVDTIKFVYQLIPLLQKHNHISSFSHFYCDDFIQNDCFYLTTYTMDEVLSRIKSLAK